MAGREVIRTSYRRSRFLPRRPQWRCGRTALVEARDRALACADGPGRDVAGAARLTTTCAEPFPTLTSTTAPGSRSSVPGHWRTSTLSPSPTGRCCTGAGFLRVGAGDSDRPATPDVADLRRHLLPGRRLARRLVPGRHRGLLLPPHLRGHRARGRRSDHLLAVEVACHPHGTRQAKRNLTGIFQHWDCIDPAGIPAGSGRRSASGTPARCAWPACRSSAPRPRGAGHARARGRPRRGRGGHRHYRHNRQP